LPAANIIEIVARRLSEFLIERDPDGLSLALGLCAPVVDGCAGDCAALADALPSPRK